MIKEIPSGSIKIISNAIVLKESTTDLYYFPHGLNDISIINIGRTSKLY
jgi:hypothetical protein